MKEIEIEGLLEGQHAYQDEKTGKIVIKNSDELTDVDRFVNGFDYESIYDNMNRLDWKYGSDSHTPNISELKRIARSVISSVVLEDYNTSSCGGFVCVRDKTDNVYAYFVLDESCPDD